MVSELLTLQGLMFSQFYVEIIFNTKYVLLCIEPRKLITQPSMQNNEYIILHHKTN
jgi:hypothetical protein